MLFTPLILLMGFIYNTQYYDVQGDTVETSWYSENDFSDIDFGHLFPDATYELSYNDVYASDENEVVLTYLNQCDVSVSYNPNTYYVTNYSGREWNIGSREDNLWHDLGFVYYDDTKTGTARYTDMGNFIRCHDNGVFRDANDNILGIEIILENTSLYERSNIRVTPFAYFHNTNWIKYVEGDFTYDFSLGNVLERNRVSRIYYPISSSIAFYQLGWKIEILPEIYVNLADEQTAFNNGSAQGQVIGYNNGYDKGFEDGAEMGYTDGYNDGYAEGNSWGRSDGFDEGRTVGYNAGYNDGVNSAHTYTFGNLFKSIIDTPIWFLQSIFGFTLFGQSNALLITITSLITICLLIAAVKKVF